MQCRDPWWPHTHHPPPPPYHWSYSSHMDRSTGSWCDHTHMLQWALRSPEQSSVNKTDQSTSLMTTDHFFGQRKVNFSNLVQYRAFLREQLFLVRSHCRKISTQSLDITDSFWLIFSSFNIDEVMLHCFVLN